MVLNDQLIRGAKPGEILWDSSLKGFGVRAGSQSKTFIVLVASGRRKKIGRYPLITLAQAREAARKVLAHKALGSLVPKHTAFDEARDEFLADCKGRLRPTTLRLYTHHLTRHFPFKRKSIGDVRPLEILRALKPLSPSQKEHAFRIGRTFFTWCSNNHLIERSPMEKMETPPKGKARERVLSDEELKRVYKQASKRKTALERLIWLMLHIGQRPGETMKLKWSYIEPDRITLPGEITKNGRTHTFPISKATYETLQTFPAESDYVFPPARSHVRGKPVETMTANSNIRQPFYKATKTSGWTLHDLRRTCATAWEQLGVRVQVTEAFLNHVSGTKAGIVGVYQRHSYFKEMQEALELWERKLETLLA